MVILADTTQQLLPRKQRQTAGRSKLAFKYSHPIGTINLISHGVLKNTNKSGLTPISATRRPITPSRVQREKWKERLRRYQTKCYYGFTLKDLEALEAVAHLDDEAFVEDTLRCPLHPVFVRGQWEKKRDIPGHMGAIPIRGEADVHWNPERGYWLAENPVVWKVLEPCIVLASMILYKANIYPWWDAIINGKMKPIPLERCPSTHQDATNPLLNFRQRDADLASSAEARARINDRLYNKAPKRIRLRLYSGYEDPRSGLPVTECRGMGLTYYSNSSKFIWINASIENLQPLLRDDLLETERLACQFKMAQTLVHEMGHAVWLSMAPEYGAVSPYEPYFDNELIGELGFSLTDKIFQGEAWEMFRHEVSRGGPGLPSIGTFKTNWFTAKSAHYRGVDMPILRPVGSQIKTFTVDEHYPIPTAWAKSLFDADMWNVNVSQYGSAATAMGPLTYGSVVDDREKGKIYTITHAEDLLIPPLDRNQVPHLMQLENERRRAANRIKRLCAEPPGSSIQSSLSPTPPASEDENDGTDFPVRFACPRYEEIKRYLLRNRRPRQLALDTMTFAMPEKTLYRYIVDRGGITPMITPFEFRSYLYIASERRELFIYAPFPGTGVVTRIPAGWPVDLSPAPEKGIPGAVIPASGLKTWVLQVLKIENTLLALYNEFGEFRDMDLGTFRNWMDRVGRGKVVVERDNLEGVVSVLSKVRGDLLALGPKDIVRFVKPIPDTMRNNAFAIAKRKADAEIFQAAASAYSASGAGAGVDSRGRGDNGSIDCSESNMGDSDFDSDIDVGDLMLEDLALLDDSE